MKMKKKNVKQKVKFEDVDLLEKDGTYLEEVLIPIAENNSAQKVSRYKTLISPISKLMIGVTCICFLLIAAYLIIMNNNYAGSYEIQEINIEYVNENLKYTQIQGTFSNIIMAYEGKSKKPVYFNLSQNYEVSESDVIFCTLSVIVDRGYEPLNTYEYFEQITINGLVVELMRTTETDFDEDLTVYTHRIKAFIDTGAELYLISFEEWTTNQVDGFVEYVDLIIDKK